MSVVRTVFFAGSTIDTVPSSMFGTQSSPRGVPTHAEPSGFVPTRTFATIAPVVGSTRHDLTVSLETQSASGEGVIQSTFARLTRVTRFVFTSTRTSAAASRVRDPERAEA